MHISHPGILRHWLARTTLALGIGLVLTGCASTEGQHQITEQVTQLQERLDAMRAELAETQSALTARDAAAESANASLADDIAGLGSRLEQLPEALAQLCPPAPVVMAAAEKCEPTVEVRTVTVTVNSDKLVVGELERVMIEPPGGLIVARVDTGADSSSLHAEEIVEFERDGRRWVRFNVKMEDGVKTIERPIKRVVRVLQQADPEGSRRPVVQLRLRLGNVRETVDFTLADRSHLNNEVLLGRNFLTDVALVDVGKQFIQPPAQDAADAVEEQ